MTDDRYYISFGGGVNSVAMTLWMLDRKMPFEEILFVDTGCEFPETYEYLKMFSEKVQAVKVIDSAEYNYGRNLYQECVKYSMVPAPRLRWCTASWKVAPLIANVTKPCFQVIGIAAEEAKRVRLSKDEGLENYYPLVENNIDRNGCVEIIKAHGLPVPRKSGCWLCPFMKVSDLKQMPDKYPDLFCKLVSLEEASIEKFAKKKGVSAYWHASNKSISTLLSFDQVNMFVDDVRPCECRT